MKHEWVKMTWREVRDRAAGDAPVVLVPIGCVEPQGPHTPTGMEFLMAEALAKEVARRANAVALPAIPFGNSNNFVNIPGTIYIRPETLTRYYEDVYRSVLRAGFSHVLFIAYHIPNQWILEEVARKVGCGTMLITRGKLGNTVFSREEGIIHSPSLSNQILDRVGAGDTVLSAASLCVAQGAPADVVGFLSNVVGAWAVATVGHRHSLDLAKLDEHVRAVLG